MKVIHYETTLINKLNKRHFIFTEYLCLNYFNTKYNIIFS